MMKLPDMLKKAAGSAAAWAPDVLMIGGAASVAYGSGLIYRPAGFIVAGVLVIVGGVMLARGAQ